MRKLFKKFACNMAKYRDDILIEKIIFKIRKLREEKGISQQVLSDATNIHIARIEAKKRDISVSTLKLLCDYFDITLSEFLKGM